jgi:hypothetical protein|eukprot:30917-Pelagococcus_subviridis.AAC.5
MTERAFGADDAAVADGSSHLALRPVRYVHLHADELRDRAVLHLHRRDREKVPERRPVLLVVLESEGRSIRANVGVESKGVSWS